MNLVNFYLVSGGDYQEVLSRLPNDSLIEKFIKKFKEDESYQLLIKGIETDDYETAFRAAHTMKGLCMTLGFGNLSRYANEITELLRAYKEEDKDRLASLIDELKIEYGKLIDNIDKMEI